MIVVFFVFCMMVDIGEIGFGMVGEGNKWGYFFGWRGF